MGFSPMLTSGATLCGGRTILYFAGQSDALNLRLMPTKLNSTLQSWTTKNPHNTSKWPQGWGTVPTF